MFPLKTTRPKIDQLDPGLAPILHNQIFRLQVTVYYLLPSQKIQRVQNLHRKQPYHILIEPFEAIGCQQFIKIPIQQFKNDALNKSKNTMWFRNKRKSLILTIPLVFPLSFSLMCVKIEISTKVCWTRSFDFFTTFIARNSFVLWSNTFNTSPKDPRFIDDMISYL